MALTFCHNLYICKWRNGRADAPQESFQEMHRSCPEGIPLGKTGVPLRITLLLNLSG